MAQTCTLSSYTMSMHTNTHKMVSAYVTTCPPEGGDPSQSHLKNVVTIGVPRKSADVRHFFVV